MLVFRTLETLPCVFIFTNILSVIPSSALSAGTKLLHLDFLRVCSQGAALMLTFRLELDI